MLGLLDSKGYQIVDDETLADIIVVNTCCFIHDAKEESIQTILDMAQYKTEGRLKALVVTGCLAQRYQQEILEEIPEVDAVLGTTSYDKIVDAVEEALEGQGHVKMQDLDALPLVETKRLVTTGGHFAYLKIAEGCDKHCTYCIIPKIRGNYRSVPMEKADQRGAGTGRAGCERVGFWLPRDYGVWNGSLREESLCRSFLENSVRSAVFGGFGFFTVIGRD